MFNFGGSTGDVTGSVGAEEKDKPAGPQLPTSTKRPDPPKVEVGNVSVQIDQGHIASAGERAVLERLQDRSKELDARMRELDMRENLIKAAEKRLESKVVELKDTEARVATAAGARDQAEAQRFKGIVAMYENMKPKEAARIFDRLELKILVDVSTQINPRKMSDILAQMSPEAAERLTVELASRASAPKRPGTDQLPKIEGKPNG
jgi:flagellar motility protein MotE (MotC chaperone)